MKILVTGSRHWTERKIIHDALHDLPEGSVIVHGANGRYVPEDRARKTGHYEGADILCAQFGWVHSYEVVPYPVTDADWKRYGLAAGPRRNRYMFDTEQPEVVYAFRLSGTSAGTDDMCRYALSRGIRVILHYLAGDRLAIHEPRSEVEYRALVAPKNA